MQVLNFIKIHFIVLVVINGGDIIQFVQYLFNLSFKEAMQKINEDFNLGLDSNVKIDYKRIKQIEKERKKNELKRKYQQDKYNQLCVEKTNLYRNIDNIKKDVSINNWENTIDLLTNIQMKCDIIDLELDELDYILSSR